jgi:hypothetical protein
MKNNKIYLLYTPEFEGKLKCIEYMCARIKVHAHALT